MKTLIPLVALLAFTLTVGLYAPMSITAARPGTQMQSGAAPTVYSDLWQSQGLRVKYDYDKHERSTLGVACCGVDVASGNDGVQYGVVGTAPMTATVNSARLFVDGYGIYTGTLELTLGVYSIDGTQERTISTAPVNLAITPSGLPIEISLTPDTVSRTIGPDEYLGYLVLRGGAQLNNVGREVVVQAVVDYLPPASVYLPDVRN